MRKPKQRKFQRRQPVTPTRKARRKVTKLRRRGSRRHPV